LSLLLRDNYNQWLRKPTTESQSARRTNGRRRLLLRCKYAVPFKCW